MRIKVAALILLFADVILLVTCGFSLAASPRAGASRAEKYHYVLWSYGIFAVLLISLFTTVLLVWIWMRKVREEYREQSMLNLQTLIEGTLQDHERKNP